MIKNRKIFGSVSVFLLSLLPLALSRISDFDYWTHLHLGRTYLADASLFELLRGNAVSGSVSWPFQLLLYKVFSWFGHPGISVLVAAIFAATFTPFVVLCHRLTGLQRWLWLLGLLLAANVVLNRLLPRPELLAYLLFAIGLLVVAAWLERPRAALLVLLFLLLLVWFVLHQTVFLGGPFLLAALLLLARPEDLLRLWPRKPFPRIVLVVAVAVIVGLSLEFAVFVFSELRPSGVLYGISEMRPTWEYPELLADFLPLAALTLILCCFAGARRWRLLLLLVAATLFGLAAARNVALAALMLLPLGGAALRESVLPEFTLRAPRVLVTVSLAMCLATFGWMVADRRPYWGVGLETGAAPLQAARFVKEQRLPLPVFNNLDCGGYLLWAWQDRESYFLDGRLGKAEQLADHNALLEAKNARPLLEKYAIDTVLLQPCYWSSGRIFPLVHLLMLDPNWSLLHASDALVFARQVPAGVTPLPKSAGWRAVLTMIDVYQRVNPEARHLDFSRGVAWQALGDFTQARAAFARGMANHPELAGGYAKFIGRLPPL